MTNNKKYMREDFSERAADLIGALEHGDPARSTGWTDGLDKKINRLTDVLLAMISEQRREQARLRGWSGKQWADQVYLACMHIKAKHAAAGLPGADICIGEVADYLLTDASTVYCHLYDAGLHMGEGFVILPGAVGGVNIDGSEKWKEAQ